MSYSLLVKGSNPLNYWQLNGTGNTVNLTGTNLSYTTPPVISNSGSSLIVRKNGSSASIINAYDVFYKNFEKATMQIELWFSFNGTMNGNGYPGSLNSSSQMYVLNKLKIVKIMNGSTEIGSIYYDYNKNTFRFSINGSGNEDAYYPVRNLHTNFYILAGYSNRQLTLMVNGDSGDPGYVKDTSLFPYKSSSVTFVIDSNSLNLSTSNFIVSDFALYDYLLNKDQQRKRVVIGYLPDKPTSITTHLESSLFDLYEKDYQTLYNKVIMGSEFLSNTLYKNNVVIDDVYGIKYKNIPSFSVSDQTSNGSSIITSSGVQMVGQTAIQMSKYGDQFAKESYQVITAQVSNVSGSSNTIFYLPEVIDNQLGLYATAGNGGFYLNSYDPITFTTSSISFISTSLNNTSTYNFGMSIVGNNVYMIGSTTTASTTIPLLSINQSTSIYVGNNPYSASSNNMYVKNLGMNNTYQTDFSGYDFTDNKMFMSRFTSDYSVSQVAIWITSIPLSNFGTEIVGSKVNWDSMDNCLVQTSLDGKTWNTILRGEQIPITYGTISNDVLLKVTVPYEYEVELENQSFNNLHITLYRDLSFLSMDGQYSLTPYTDSSGAHSYAIKKIPEPMLQRLTKFGLHFDHSSGTTDGYAVIAPTSSAYQPYAIDFWFKADYWAPTQSYVLDQATANAVHPQIYFEQSSNHLRYGSGSVYINGNYYADNVFTASTGEYYHIFYSFGAPSASPFYINGQYQTSAKHSHASYAYINLWNSAVSASTASARYNHFVANNIQAINDIPVSLWQPSYYNDALTTASGYKIG